MGVELRPRAFLRHWTKLSGGLLRLPPAPICLQTHIQAQDLEADGFESFATHNQGHQSEQTPIYGKTTIAWNLLPSPKLLTHFRMPEIGGRWIKYMTLGILRQWPAWTKNPFATVAWTKNTGFSIWFQAPCLAGTKWTYHCCLSQNQFSGGLV